MHLPHPVNRRHALSLIGSGIAAGAMGVTPRTVGSNVTTTSLDDQLMTKVADFGASNARVRTLIVARYGNIALAEAFRGPGLNTPVAVKSISKTLVAAITGAAIDRGEITGVDTQVGAILGSLIPTAADQRVHTITIADLLTMQAGLQRTSGRFYGAWVNSPDWLSYALSRPFVAEPGNGMLYSTGSYHILGAVLTEATGRSLRDLGRDWLGAPLGIDFPPWTRDPQGYFMGGNEMALSPNDLFKFGEMIRQDGAWQGRWVLSKAWISQSWTPHTRSPFSGDAYGYGWFLRSAHGHQIGYGRGFGGQMLYVVPSLGLTVVVISDPTQRAFSHGYVGELNTLLEDTIIPAALRG